MIELAQIVTPKANILEGLHVLLVTEDDVRAAALTRALRDLKASVGDVKVSGKDAFALRGADLLVVDACSKSATQARVTELRSDVRGRWASLIELDYTKLVLEDGAILLKPLEEAAAPHVLADKELTERARKEEKLELKLAPLGPSRVLRALAAAGPTMHVQIVHETLSATVDLSNELLVCAFAERGTSEKWEAWTALVRILGLPDANVHVSRRSHPSAMNIMEPIDQALEVAAQERHSSAALIAVEERSAKARAEENVKPRPAAPDENVDLPALAPKSKSTVFGAPKLDKALLGLSGGSPPQLAAPVRPPAESRYTVGDGAAAERVKPKARTLLGMAGMNAAPATLPALGSKSRPAGSVPAPVVGLAAPALLKPAVANPAPKDAAPSASAKEMSLPRVTFGDVPTDPHLVPPVELLHEKPTVEFQALDEERPNAMRPTAPANDVTSQEGHDDGDATLIADAARARGLVAASMELPHPNEEIVDLPAAAAPQGPQGPAWAQRKGYVVPTAPVAPREPIISVEPGAVTTDPPEAETPTDPAHLAITAKQAVPPAVATTQATAQAREPVDPRAQTQQLMAVIDEAVDSAPFSNPPGVKPMVSLSPSPTEPEDTIFMTRVERKSRAKFLTALLALALIEAVVVVYFDRRLLNLEKQEPEIAVSSRATAPPRVRGAMPKPEPALPAAPSTTAAQQVAQPAEPVAAATTIGAQPPEAKTPEPGAAAAQAPEPAKPAEPANLEPPPKPAEAEPDPVVATPEPSQANNTPTKGAGAHGRDGDALVREAMGLLDSGNAASAREIFAQALAADPKNPHAHAGLAETLLATGDAQGAMASIQTAIKLRPKRARYRVIQGDILKAEGDASAAQAAYREALSIDPDDREAKKRLAR